MIAVRTDSEKRSTLQRPSFPRIHWLTWLVLLAATGIAVLLEVPGFGVKPTLLESQPFMWGASGTGAGLMPNPDEAEGPLQVEEFIHGWPLTYCRRSSGYGGKGWTRKRNGPPAVIPVDGAFGWVDGCPWNLRAAWTFDSNESRWSPVAMVADFVLAVGGVAVAVLAVQTWIRRRGGRVRLRIIDLLALTTVVAVVAGWRQLHVTQHSREEAALETLRGWAPQGGGKLQHTWSYRGPEWLVRLAGSHRFPYCFHLTYAQVFTENHDLLVATFLDDLKFVETLQIVGPLSSASVEAMATLPNLRELRLVNFSVSRATGDSPTPRRMAETFRVMQQLTRFEGLEKLSLRDRGVLIEDVERLVKEIAVSQLDIAGISATIDEKNSFCRAHPKLSVVASRGEPSTAAAEALFWNTANRRLHRWAWEDSNQRSSELPASSLPRATWGQLRLQGFELTPERIERLQRVLPECVSLKVGSGYSADQLASLLTSMHELESFDASDVDATSDLLRALARCKSLEMLSIRQGSAAVQDFTHLRNLPKLQIAQIYASSLTWQEVEAIQRFFPVAIIDFYRGADSESEFITRPLTPDEKDPFGGFG